MVRFRFWTLFGFAVALCGCSLDASLFSSGSKIPIIVGPKFVFESGVFPLGKNKFHYQTGYQTRFLKNSRRIINFSNDTTDPKKAKVFDMNGNFLFSFGEYGTAPGQIQAELFYNFVVDDTAGNLYFIESEQNRVQVFDSTGHYVMGWGTSGSGVGQMNSPMGIGIDADENLYVADTANNRVQKFSKVGAPLGQFGSGVLNSPSAVEVNSHGEIYVFHSSNVIERYDSSFNHLGSWTVPSYNMVSSLAIDSTDKVYNTAFGSEISVYGRDGTSLGTFPGSVNGDYTQAVNTDGADILVWKVSKGFYRYDSLGNLLASYVSFGNGVNELDYPQSVAVGPLTQNVYIADFRNHRIVKRNSRGATLLTWGGLGSAIGQFNSPYAIALDSEENVYVADRLNYRVQKFDSSGAFITSWGSNGTGAGQFKSAFAIAVDSEDSVYVGDSNLKTVQKFTSEGVHQLTFGGAGTTGLEQGLFKTIKTLIVDKQGDIHVLDSTSGRIQRFSNQGQYVGEFGSFGTADNQLNKPAGLAIDSKGNFYVTDDYCKCVKVFDKNGVFTKKWGSKGINASLAEFSTIAGIAIDYFDRVLVTDTFLNIVQRFDADGHPSP